ncbi:sulfatase-like hydrolase/transferase [Stieleria sp. TO1_6]|uniref:sulfatase-like hydrolase/transferase n=1 Tax=Stieleria tagensis TaxID=2956795 RepID=UPI00209AF57D|nr:sulfatase-like hydrolase/transferase [Stieleria tagensis]MCO8120545.1 sulfatase-like hydrolase/transferase [Stieleria tagensis]
MIRAPFASVVPILFLLAAAFTATPAAADTRPNVIFILLDDMGWGDFGVLYQNESQHAKRHQTPMLDQMAAQGMQLRAHYCPAPVCAPSRSSLLTGVHQGHAEVRDNQFDKALADNHTLASVMKSAGYTTWLVGKYGLQGGAEKSDDDKTPAAWPAYPTKRGFDEFYGYVRHRDGHVHYPAETWNLGDSPSHRTPKQVWHNDQEVSKDLAKCYTTDLFTARSKDWIVNHVQGGSKDPFFLYLAYDTPHAALQVPSVPYPAGRGLNGGLQWTGKPGQMINTAAGTVDGYRHPDYTGKGWTDVEERFATMVRRIDDSIGDLLQTLRELSIDQDTLVVVSCDNGPHHESYLRDLNDKRINYTPESFQSYGPFDGTKRDVWEGGIRVGTLAWWPGKIAAGSIDDTPSQFQDWMPTFARAGGIAPPARTDGVSLLPTLTGQGQQRPGQVYIEYFNGGKTPAYDDFQNSKRNRPRKQMQVVFVDGYKGVRVDVKDHQQPFAIYDLKNDPKELKNLAGQGGQFATLQQKMHDRVLQLRRANASAPRPYDKAAVPSIDAPAQSDWAYETYDGDFKFVPDVNDLSAQDSGRCDSFDAVTATGAVRFRGTFTAPTTGVYRVTLSTASPAFARIHDAELIDADFGFDASRGYSTEIRLQKGVHPLTITTLAAGQVDLKLDWQKQVKGDGSGSANRQ